jgi:hypothetical protein
MEAKEVKGLWEAYVSVYTNLSESHFKVGDKVICKDSGMKGEVVKLDKPDGAEDEKYYTVEREDGKKMKYAPNELKSAGNGGASKEKETKFHTKLDKLVHSTFGSSPEEKKMKKGKKSKKSEEDDEDEEEELDEALTGERIKKVIRKPGGTNYTRMHSADPAKRPTKRGGRGEKGASKQHDFGAADRGAGNKAARRSGTYQDQNEEFVDEETDLFDYILEHLVAEGYADTNDAALAIMANMSEEWRESIIEETKRTEYLQKKFNKENERKSGSALKHIPGKQNTGQALQKSRESERHMRG